MNCNYSPKRLRIDGQSLLCDATIAGHSFTALELWSYNPHTSVVLRDDHHEQVPTRQLQNIRLEANE